MTVFSSQSPFERNVPRDGDAGVVRVVVALEADCAEDVSAKRRPVSRVSTTCFSFQLTGPSRRFVGAVPTRSAAETGGRTSVGIGTIGISAGVVGWIRMRSDGRSGLIAMSFCRSAVRAVRRRRWCLTQMLTNVSTLNTTLAMATPDSDEYGLLILCKMHHELFVA